MNRQLAGQYRQRAVGAAAALSLAVCLSAGCRRTPPLATTAQIASPPRFGRQPPASNPLAGRQPTPHLFVQSHHAPKLVALTFDAGADASGVALILRTLAAHHTRATFFLTGKFCEHFPKACRAIADAGMEIGNHSYSHPNFRHITDAQAAEQLEQAENAIRRVCGRGAKPLFRFPYGESDTRTRAFVASRGYQGVHWTLDSMDSFGRPKSAAFVAKRIINRIQPGYITLMHVSRLQSAKSLPAIFARLDRMGVHSVPVSELMLTSPPPDLLARKD